MDRGVFLSSFALGVLLWFLFLAKLPHQQHTSAGGESSYQCVSVLLGVLDRLLPT